MHCKIDSWHALSSHVYAKTHAISYKFSDNHATVLHLHHYSKSGYHGKYGSMLESSLLM